MDQQGIGAGGVVGLGTLQGLSQAATRDQRLDAGDQAEIIIGLAVLAGLDLAAELIDVGQRLAFANEGIGLGKQLVFDADAGDTALTQLVHHPPQIVEIAIARITVHQHGDGRCVGHELENLQHLGP